MVWVVYWNRAEARAALAGRGCQPVPLVQEVDQETYALQPSPGNGFLVAKGLPGLLAGARVLESPNLG